MTTKGLIIVDVQPTFCEGGELGVEGGNECARAIARYIRSNHARYDFLATTQDWHIDPGSHFSETPDFVDSWPPHGPADSDNAQLHPEIAAALRDLEDVRHYKKGQYQAAYSGFEGADDGGETLDEALARARVTQVDIVGIAESHCVKQTALDAVALGYGTHVVSNLTVPVSPELGRIAREQMQSAGVELVTVDLS